MRVISSPSLLYTTSVKRKFVHPTYSGYFLSFLELNKKSYFIQKGSLGYYLSVILYQGVFLPVFKKKLKAAVKKTQVNFGKKTQHYGGNFGYQEKKLKYF